MRRHWGRHTGSTATVSIHVRDLAQMFNSLDPSPFWDRDLDPAAAEFIEEEFRDRLTAGSWHLHVYVHERTGSAADLQAAVENYYGRMAHSARLALREHLWMGQLALVGGFVIFLISMAAREAVRRLLGHLPGMLDEGLIILAWLALWRPAEALMYEWVPFYRRRRLFERLAGMHVSVRPAQDGRAQPGLAKTPAESETPPP